MQPSKLVVGVLTSFICIIVVIIAIVIWVGSGSFRPRWEITDKELAKIEPADYRIIEDKTIKANAITNADFGMKCGEITVHLGDSIDISKYTELASETVDGVERKYVQAPSKRYELIVVQSGDAWRVHKIRTTNPGVKNTRGYSITDKYDVVSKYYADGIKGKRVVTIVNDDETMQLQLSFASGILCEMSISYKT